MKQSRSIKPVSLSVAVPPLFYLDYFVPRNDDTTGLSRRCAPRNDGKEEYIEYGKIRKLPD
jgi:hypothetical protein